MEDRGRGRRLRWKTEGGEEIKVEDRGRGRGRGRRLRRKTEGGAGGDSCSLRVLHVTQDANKVKTFLRFGCLWNRVTFNITGTLYLT